MSAETEAIVRDLVRDRWIYPSDELGHCFLCWSEEAEAFFGGRQTHTPSCPWRRAREWVESHPIEVPR